MPNVDDHMDELFKKAAENYPLKTRPGNFDDLLPFVGSEPGTAAAPVTKTNGKRKFALLLLAFLITGGSIGTYLVVDNNNSKPTGEKTVTTKSVNSNPESKIHSATTNITETQATDQSVAGHDIDITATESVFKKVRKSSNSNTKFLARLSAPSASEGEEATGNSLTDYITVSPNQDSKANPRLEPASDTEKKSDNKKEIALKTNPEKNPAENETTEKSPAEKKKKNKPAVYYGVSAGVELNQVKNQGMTKAGINASALVGLQISKKISVETGVQLSQKKYYTAGKHFNAKADDMPSNMTINSLEGTSTLIEIPVSVKYNFNKKDKGFYGKAGVSSYIMTKEANTYKAVVSGQAQEFNGIYKNTKGYAAAEVRISAGYQRPVGKKLNIRAEPYIQIPLKGIGVGALPVTSTGLQFVLTRN
ncbi:MAG: PorT family protein [Chitinophagaceae bacterium]|nr:PorT family protein [Chitinophagaceae bacterium]